MSQDTDRNLEQNSEVVDTVSYCSETEGYIGNNQDLSDFFMFLTEQERIRMGVIGVE